MTNWSPLLVAVLCVSFSLKSLAAVTDPEDFGAGDLSATVGSSPQYQDMTPSQIQFGITASFGSPAPTGSDLNIAVVQFSGLTSNTIPL